MNEELIGQALIELADIANCVSGDFHCLHFNVQGTEFDMLHKKVLKKYYEEAANDYDEFAEKARMFGVLFPNPNEAASRIEFQSVQPTVPWDKAWVVMHSKKLMDALQEQYLKVYQILNKIDDCTRSIGVANFLQTRLEYWSKECYYFNQSRGGEG